MVTGTIRATLWGALGMALTAGVAPWFSERLFERTDRRFRFPVYQGATALQRQDGANRAPGLNLSSRRQSRDCAADRHPDATPIWASRTGLAVPTLGIIRGYRRPMRALDLRDDRMQVLSCALASMSSDFLRSYPRLFLSRWATSLRALPRNFAKPLINSSCRLSPLKRFSRSCARCATRRRSLLARRRVHDECSRASTYRSPLRSTRILAVLALIPFHGRRGTTYPALMAPHGSNRRKISREMVEMTTP